MFKGNMVQVNPIQSMNTIFLLGAGASKPAGIPTIDEMTKEFLSDPYKRVKFHGEKEELVSNIVGKMESGKLTILSEVASDYYRKGDLEFMMTLLGQLEDERSIDFFETKYPQLKEIMAHAKNISEKKEIIKWYKNLIQDFVRNACENITNIDYLWPLSGLINKTPMSIFTLNYDGIVENYSEKNHLEYRDGFDPYWNPKRFEDQNSKINLYKLHGSLYWLRTKSGKIVKTPIQGINISSMKYIDGDSLSELMLYPQLQKDKQLEVFSWLDRKFKDELNRSDNCVAIGYSFRDDEIRNSILESLLSNPRMWLVIVSPHATKHKMSLFSSSEEVGTKIVSIDMGVEEALRERKLHSYLSTLENARQVEEQTNLSQQSSQIRLDGGWKHALTNYLKINHHDRIRWIVEKLSKEKFTEVEGNFPETIEGIVYANTLVYAFEYRSKKDTEKMDVWKKMFLESCKAFEFRYFYMRSMELRKNNPVKEEELPFWCNPNGAGFVIEYYLENMKKTLIDISLTLEDGSLKQAFEKLIETFDVITHKEPTGQGGYTIFSDDQIWNMYQTKDLGMKKWSTKIVNLLN